MVEAITVPAEGFAEQAFTISYRVTNVGEVATTSAWTDRLVFAGDLSPDMGGNHDALRPYALGVGQFYERILGPFTFPWTFAGETGSFSIDIYVDVFAEEKEVPSEDDNFIHVPAVTVHPIDRPDLVPSITFLAPPTNGNGGYDSGTDVALMFQVSNLGPAATGAPQWVDSVYLVEDDGDGLPPTNLVGAELLASRQNLTYLLPGTGTEPGTFYVTSLDVDLPGNIEGDYFLGVATDVGQPGGSVLEEDEGNNLVFSTLLRIDLEAQADLVVQSIDDVPVAPAFWGSGEHVVVNWTLRNDGTAPAIGYVADAIRLLEDGGALVATLNSYTGAISLLPGGGTVDRSTLVYLPEGLATGPYRLELQTNVNAAVPELGPGGGANNVLSSVPFEIRLSPRVELIAQSLGPVTPGIPVQAGALVDVNWSVGTDQGGVGPDAPISWSDSLHLVPEADILAHGGGAFDTSGYPTLWSFEQGNYFDPLLGTSGHWAVPLPGYQKTRSLLVPLSTLPGSYGLVLSVDSSDVVVEENETNNQLWSGPGGFIAIESHPADLSIASGALIGSENFSSSVSGSPGSQISLAWTVDNVSTDPEGATTSGWWDQVFLSTDGVTLQNPRLLTSAWNLAGLGPADPVLPHVQTATVPLVAAGSYYLFYYADPGGAVYDSDPGNNLVIEPFQVTPEVANLTLLGATSQEQMEPGEPILVNWSVDNAGTAATLATYWLDSVYLSPDVVPNPNSASNIWIGSVARTSALAPGDAPYLAQQQFGVPSSLAPGEYWVLVKCDSSNGVFESDETDNWDATRTTYQVAAAPPADLTLQNVAAAAAVTSGQSLAVDYDVKNLGPGTTSSPSWTESFYLSLDHSLDGADLYLGYKSHGAVLMAGEVRPVHVELAVPLAVSGSFTLLVKTNSNGAVDEDGATGNNLAYDPSFVTITTADPVDLVVSAAELLPLGGGAPLVSGLSGEPLWVRWTIVNQSVTDVNGVWTDGFYLSADSVWTPDDAFIGSVERPVSTLIGGGQQELTSGGAPVPLLLPPLLGGSYYLIAVADQLNQIPEFDEIDNAFVSSTPIQVAPIDLALDTPLDFELPNQQQRWLRVSPAVDQTIDIVLSHLNNPAAWVELYVREASLPSTGVYDLSGVDPQQGTQTVRIPKATGSDYFILARALAGVGTGQPQTTARIEAQVKSYLLDQVSPANPGTGIVTLEFRGSELWRTTNLALRPLGGGQIDDVAPVAPIVYDEGSGDLRALFDLSAAGLGTYDAVIYDTGSSLEFVLPAAVQVEAAAPLRMALDVEVTPSLRRGQSGSIELVFRNPGNVNIAYSAVSLAFEQALAAALPDERIEITSAQLGGQPLVMNGAEEFQVFFLEDLGPSQSHRVRFELTVGADWPLEYMGLVVSGTPWAQTDPTLEVYTQVPPQNPIPRSVFEAVAVALQTAVWNDTAASDPVYQLAQSEQTWFNAINSELLFDDDLMHGPVSEVKTVADLLLAMSQAITTSLALNPGEVISPATMALAELGLVCAPFAESRLVCEGLYPGVFQNTLHTGTVHISYGSEEIGIARISAQVRDPDDPNGKTNPGGIGPKQYVSASQTVEYSVFFENQQLAGAWASEVRLTDQFETTLNGPSVRLSEIQIGTNLLLLPPNTGSYFNELWLTGADGLPLRTRISAGLDATTNTLEWVFQAIDPATGQLVAGIDQGLLPPTGLFGPGTSGGHVTFAIFPAQPPGPGLSTLSGTTVRNRVRIQMNQAPPIVTGQVENTLDADPPTSQLIEGSAPLPLLDTNVHLEWSATDAMPQDEGSGVASYSVYSSLSEFGQRFPVALDTIETSGVFEGEAGGEYWFFCEAKDLVGNEEHKLFADLFVQIPGDCNDNGVGDAEDISSGTSLDCNGNGIPDECDVADAELDCNSNGIPDSCDVATGTSGDDNDNGTPDECECLVSRHCTAAPNTAGAGAVLDVQAGSSVSLAANDLVLTIVGGPPNKFGIFFYGPNAESETPFGEGFRCVGGSLFRIQPPLQIAGDGSVTRVIDYGTPPMNGGGGQVSADSTWNFQFWYRDPQGGPSGFNASDALRITFCQ
jgi:hypothetical protein